MVGRSLFRMLLHHDPNAAQGAEGIRAVLGEDWAHQISVTLHTTGALFVAAGLAAVLLLQSLRGSGTSLWNDRNRAWIRGAVLGGWVINFLGGIARVYQPDHPGLSSFGEVGWVQLLVLKHIALLGAVGFSLLAIEMGPEAWTRRLRQHAAIALVLVLFASLAGGVATGLPLPRMVMDDGTMSETPGGPPDEAIIVWRNATLDLDGATPLTPKTNSLSIDVPPFASEILVQFTWNGLATSVWAELIDPEGELRRVSGNVTPNSGEVGVDTNVIEGTWTLRVKSDRALAESVTIATRITQGGETYRVLEETVTVTDFFEINMYMDPGEYFNYTWSIASDEAPVPWDIHSHPDGEVVYHHEGRDRSAEGNFTAGPNEIYSIFWYPDPGQPVTLTYRVEGNFTVHSIYR